MPSKIAMSVRESPIDVNMALTPEQSRSQIWTVLASVDLHKYMEKIIEAGIDFHTFCNLTQPDMRRLGIINNADQERLMAIVKPMQMMYMELDSYEVDWTRVADNIKASSNMLAGSLLELNRKMKSNPILDQSLADCDTPSFAAALLLIDLIESRLDLIDRDLRQILHKRETNHKNSRSSLVVVCSLLALTAASAVWYFKTPLRRLL